MLGRNGSVLLEIIREIGGAGEMKLPRDVVDAPRVVLQGELHLHHGILVDGVLGGLARHGRHDARQIARRHVHLVSVEAHTARLAVMARQEGHKAREEFRAPRGEGALAQSAAREICAIGVEEGTYLQDGNAPHVLRAAEAGRGADGGEESARHGGNRRGVEEAVLHDRGRRGHADHRLVHDVGRKGQILHTEVGRGVPDHVDISGEEQIDSAGPLREAAEVDLRGGRARRTQHDIPVLDADARVQILGKDSRVQRHRALGRDMPSLCTHNGV